MSNRLSVCLLTRNEERSIEQAIRSVEGIADEIIVADTGSTDRTVELAQGAGARVVSIPWDDDFSAGRNSAINEASGDWILWLNPDEKLNQSIASVVPSLIADHVDAFGYLARIQHQAMAERPDQYAETWDLRLFRRRPDLRYVGRLHPSLAPNPIEEGRGADEIRIVPSDLTIRRYAYLSVLDPEKLRWAARLLRKELDDRPGQLHFLIEYGRTLLRLGDPEGHQVMAEAIDRIASESNAPSPPSPDVQLVLEYVLNTTPDREQSRLSKAEAASLTLRWFPNSPALLWTLAESYFRTRQFAAAAVLLNRLVQLGESGAFDRSLPFDPTIIGPRASLNLVQCLRAIGRSEEARQLAIRLESDPDVGDSASAILAELDGPEQGGDAEREPLPPTG